MHGLYLLWWVQEKHVAPAIVAALIAAGDLAIAALEIPTGWIADRFGHRASLLLGSLAQIAGMLMSWLGEGVPGLLTAILLVAVGDAFRSGADQALLYRSCVALGREADFQRIESRSRSAQLATLVAMVLAGGAIVAAWGFAVGWAVETAVSAIGLVMAAAMVEPPAATDSIDHQSNESWADVGNEAPPGGGRPIAIATLAKLIIPASVLSAVVSATAFAVQIRADANPSHLTILVASFTLAEAGGALLAGRLQASGRNQAVLFGLAAFAALTAVVVPPAFVTIVVALSFLTGTAETLRRTAIQRFAADHLRARAASLASACDTALRTVTLLVAGSFSRRRSGS